MRAYTVKGAAIGEYLLGKSLYTVAWKPGKFVGGYLGLLLGGVIGFCAYFIDYIIKAALIKYHVFRDAIASAAEHFHEIEGGAVRDDAIEKAGSVGASLVGALGGYTTLSIYYVADFILELVNLDTKHAYKDEAWKIGKALTSIVGGVSAVYISVPFLIADQLILAFDYTYNTLSCWICSR